MTDEQRLHDELQALVPAASPAPDRATQVRRLVRSRRRRATAATVVAAAAVMAALAVVPSWVSGDADTPGPAAPTPSPSPTSDIAGPGRFSCPDPQTTPAGPGTLPPGAVAVRLCDGPGIGFDEPDDALVTGVDDLVRVVNAQEVTGPPRGCRADLGTGYLLAFEYADGTVEPVTGELYGCNTLAVGSSVRAHPELPWRRFIDLLRLQRAGPQMPTQPAARPSCADSDIGTGLGTSPVGRPDEMTAAVLCVRYETSAEQSPLEVTVPDEDLAVLLADRAARAHPAAPAGECGPTTASWRLVGRSPWGDLTAVDAWCGQWSDGRGHYWDPGPEAQRILDRLVAEAGQPVPEVDGRSTAREVVAAYIGLLNAGDRTGAAALWHPMMGAELPTTYTHIDYKVEGVRSLPWISAWRDATAVRALYRERVRDAYVPYREAIFTLGRDEKGVFRIVNLHRGDVVDTGR